MTGYCAKCGTFGRLDRYTAMCAAHTPHPVTARQVEASP